MEAAKALFFDLNGTLLDGSEHQEAVRRTCVDVAAAQPGLDAARLLVANSEVWRKYWPDVEDRWTLGVLDGATVSFEGWRRTLRACGFDDDSLARLARDALRRHERQTVRLFDDVQELLASLSRMRLPLALVTNGASDTQRDALRVLGIEQRFGAVVVSGEVGIAKPDPAVFAIALDRLGVKPESVWHVGDSLAADVVGAQAAGITAIWLNRGGPRRRDADPKPDHELRSLTELTGLLAPRA